MKFREFKEKVRNYPLFGSDIVDLLSPSPQALRNQINRWEKMGLILELRRGLYTLSPSERGVGSHPQFKTIPKSPTRIVPH